MMAYDRGLAQRVREILEERPGFAEKKMFGGLCFLLYDNMACGILDDELIVRVGPHNYEAALKKANARKFDPTGKPMRGWVVIGAEALDSDQDLTNWVAKGVNLALSLPTK